MVKPVSGSHHAAMNSENLSPITQEIAGIVGLSNALCLSFMFGGRQIQMMGEVRREIASTMGAQCAEALAFHFGQTPIYIPMNKASATRARDAQIIGQFTETTGKGISARHAVADLSKAFMLSERRIWNILKRGAP
jgi:Mor family transcriptional regulator